MAPEESDNDDERLRHEQRSKSRQRLAKIVAVFIATAVVVVVIQAFFLNMATVPSQSMTPTLKVGDHVLINKTATVKRNSIVALDGSKLSAVGAPSQLLFKRVLATSGDTVEIRDRQILVNGSAVKAPVIPSDAQLANIAPLRVEPGKIWVIGDNLNNSQDSRDFGGIPSNSVEGVVWVRDLPF